MNDSITLHLLGYVGAVLIGVSLGLIGGGGTILTVPVLVYVFNISPVVAMGYSMFIVGLTSGVGTISNVRNKLVDTRIAFLFGLPALLMIIITRKFIIHAIPEILFRVNNYDFTRDTGLMVLFAVLMIGAAYSMIRNNQFELSEDARQQFSTRKRWLILQGLGLGLLSGLLGAGGGFMIVPALVLFSGMEMKKAVATSLLIICINLTIGFAAVLWGPHYINWSFLLVFTALAIVGILFGGYLTRFIPGNKLKPIFGIFILLMGIYVISKELFLK